MTFSPVPSKDMQTPSLPSPFRIGPILMIDAHNAESNEKINVRFSSFDLWLIIYTIYDNTPSVSQ